ncbi:hypothetical protein [Thiomicrorhabdus sp.]|uniref:hypothetical protein n=1 Tax=Thiomicrorhabdus sp. TaxID=2039724 RepID=UPI0029C6ED7C|nr:hypothetical protein [Thiomicrorhabdus sp.]
MSQDALQKTRLILLSHSKNMLNAAQSQDWEAFLPLESVWQEKLEQAVEQWGQQLNEIIPSLLEDNRQIQQAIKSYQQDLAGDLKQSRYVHKALKEYLA